MSNSNCVLAQQSPQILRTLAVEEFRYANGAVLFTAEETPRYVFFPQTPVVVSIVRSTGEGTTVEAGVVGSEGIVSIQTVLAEPAPTGNRGVVQTEGVMARAEIGRVREAFRIDETFRGSALAFTASFLDQITQNLVCNRLHEIEQRLAKWLLLVYDRTGSNDLHLTQEFLAHMLGVHRPGVTIAVNALAADGLVRHGRNHLVIEDHPGLEQRSCECYGVLHAALLQLRSVFVG